MLYEDAYSMMYVFLVLRSSFLNIHIGRIVDCTVVVVFGISAVGLRHCCGSSSLKQTKRLI